MSESWALLFLLCFLREALPSFQASLCDWLDNAVKYSHDIHLTTLTIDASINEPSSIIFLHLHDNLATEVAITSLNSVKFDLKISPSFNFYRKWFDLKSITFGRNIRTIAESDQLKQFEILPGKCRNESEPIYHFRFRKVNDDFVFFENGTNAEPGQAYPTSDYQIVTDVKGCKGYMFRYVKYEQREILVVENLHELMLNGYSTKYEFILTSAKSILYRLFDPKQSTTHPEVEQQFISVPSGFIHQENVYLFDFKFEVLYIFPFMVFKAEKDFSRTLEMTKIIQLRRFMYCDSSGNNGNRTASKTPLSWAARYKLLIVVVLLVVAVLLIAVAFMLWNMSRNIAKSEFKLNFNKSIQLYKHQTSSETYSLKKGDETNKQGRSINKHLTNRGPKNNSTKRRRNLNTNMTRRGYSAKIKESRKRQRVVQPSFGQGNSVSNSTNDSYKMT